MKYPIIILLMVCPLALAYTQHRAPLIQEFTKSSTFDSASYKAQQQLHLATGISAVTYGLSGGRLGDNLLCYLHAKWISYKYHIPLLYYPFEYSSHLVLDEAELLSTVGNTDALKKYDNGQPVNKILWINTVNIKADEGSLYIVPWFPESIVEFERLEDARAYFYVNWDDENFINHVRELIYPRCPLRLISLPPNTITVAVHVRRNSNGFDLSMSFAYDAPPQGKQYLDDYYPFKCVNDDFYIYGIKKIRELYRDKPLYVFIFTDDKDPASIAAKYRQALNDDSITLDYRHEPHDHTTNVLEDFFSMLRFDCLIRADSNFSLVASKLGSYKVVISPAGYCLRNNHPIIVKAHITTTVEIERHKTSCA